MLTYSNRDASLSDILKYVCVTLRCDALKCVTHDIEICLYMSVSESHVEMSHIEMCRIEMCHVSLIAMCHIETCLCERCRNAIRHVTAARA